MQNAKLIFGRLVFLIILLGINEGGVFGQLKLHKTITPQPVRGREIFKKIMVNDFGDIYLIEQGLSEVYWLDSTGTILKRNGGFGWAPPQLNQPIDLGTMTGIDVVIIDRANLQIILFDRQLNYLTNLPLQKYLSGMAYPVSVAANRMGEIYILLAEANQVLKLENFNKAVTYFGGFDYADYALNQPAQIRLDPNGRVVIANQECVLYEFDRYGAPLLKVTPPQKVQVDGLILTPNKRLIIAARSSRFLSYSLRSNSWELLDIGLPRGAKRILAGTYSNRRLYLLCDNNLIGVYRLEE